MAEPQAPKAPQAPKNAPKLTVKSDKIEVLKTFIWSAEVKDVNQTFLAGERLIGFPADGDLIAKYVEAGFIALPVKEED